MAAYYQGCDGIEKPRPNRSGYTYYTVKPWDGLCQVCHKRPGTEEVVGCPGGIDHECRQCSVESMLKSAREHAARIPELERELAELTKKGP